MSDGVWSSDVIPSMPQPPKEKVLVPMEGMGFTVYGICHDLTEDDFEQMITPMYAPMSMVIRRGVQ